MLSVLVQPTQCHHNVVDPVHATGPMVVPVFAFAFAFAFACEMAVVVGGS